MRVTRLSSAGGSFALQAGDNLKSFFGSLMFSIFELLDSHPKLEWVDGGHEPLPTLSIKGIKNPGVRSSLLMNSDLLNAFCCTFRTGSQLCSRRSESEQTSLPAPSAHNSCLHGTADEYLFAHLQGLLHTSPLGFQPPTEGHKQERGLSLECFPANKSPDTLRKMVNAFSEAKQAYISLRMFLIP